MAENLLRWTWAILVPPALMALFVAGISEGSPALFLLLIVGTVAVGQRSPR